MLTCNTGWIPATPDFFYDLKFPPKIFVNPPRSHIVEYSTRSGSFRLRERHADEPYVVTGYQG